jgi:hypothetical protein
LLRIKGLPGEFGQAFSMTPFLFLCPATGRMVQAIHDDDTADRSERPGESYIGVECLSCGDVHLVNPQTGRVLGHSHE